MRRSRFFCFLLICLLAINAKHILAQSLHMDTISVIQNGVDSINDEMATIIFISSIEDLSIVCTDENPNEPIAQINDTIWTMRINVKKDIEADGFCFRNFIIQSSSSVEYYLTTPIIELNQILYYRLIPKLQVTLSPDKSKVDRSTSNGAATIFFDSKIKDLSIVCTDANINESIAIMGNHLRYSNIDVKKGHRE